MATKVLTASQRVGSYRLVQPLKAGQDGEVWLATKEMVDTRYAIKFLKSLDEDGRERFAREVAKMAATGGLATHLIRIHDVGEEADTGLPYYVMDLIPSVKELNDVLASGSGPSVVLDMLRGALTGLNQLHKDVGVNHNDVKAANLLVRADSEPFLYVTDYGFLQERGLETEPRSAWKESSVKWPEWLHADDVDVFQLARTFADLTRRNGLDRFPSGAWTLAICSFVDWPNGQRLPDCDSLLAELGVCRALSAADCLPWSQLSRDLFADLVRAVYEYDQGSLTTESVLSLLTTQRKPPIEVTKDTERTALAVLRDVLKRHGFSGAKEIARAIVLGLPSLGSREEELRDEFKFLDWLLDSVPDRMPETEEQQKYTRYLHAEIRRRQLQVSVWDAGVSFLTAGSGTLVSFVASDTGFAVAGDDDWSARLRTTAIGALQRGAHFRFLVPPKSEAHHSAKQFKQRVPNALRERIEVMPIRNSGQRSKKAGNDVGFFTPGFRFVLFEKGTPGFPRYDMFYVGLPRTQSEGFALRFASDHLITEAFKRWANDDK